MGDISKGVANTLNRPRQKNKQKGRKTNGRWVDKLIAVGSALACYTSTLYSGFESRNLSKIKMGDTSKGGAKHTLAHQKKKCKKMIFTTT
jgi:hypothetical protein